MAHAFRAGESNSGGVVCVTFGARDSGWKGRILCDECLAVLELKSNVHRIAYS